MHAKFDRDTFLVNQKHLAWGKSKYYVYDEQGTALFYVERPTMRLFGRRANVTIFHDDTANDVALLLRQDHGYEFRRREYTLVDPSEGDRVLARLCRDNIRALFKRRWEIFDASSATAARAREDSTLMAVVRRAVDWIPYVSLLGWAIKTDFHIFTVDGSGGETKAGSFDRRLGIGDKYVLNLRDDPGRRLDRRIALALGILLDTAEAR